MTNRRDDDTRAGFGIAVVGLAGRFPGAASAQEFWANVCHGTETIAHFSEAELLDAGIAPRLVEDGGYVRAWGVVADAERFDAAFFGYSPREARTIDPQQRAFLECAWSALEHAGYRPDTFPGAIGVYAGASANGSAGTPAPPDDAAAFAEAYETAISRSADALAPRVSYKLDLRGPSVVVQTYCSTSLVAVHMACRALRAGDCDMALAGGTSIRYPRAGGYHYTEGGIFSPDGHCRAFDAGARGTVGGDGVGIVVLKRLEDAVADGDTIHAVIAGSAINNEGALRAGFTAPSVEGQADVVGAAHEAAGVDPRAIGYVEAHGTGTPLGDPIEIAALTLAFGSPADGRPWCAIGSVKTNVGHLDAAAGIAGLIKAVMAVKHGILPPTLHFERANPEIDFAAGPFFVNTASREWPHGAPRRAGVSSFGIGGTNAHVVVQEAPRVSPSGASRPWQVVTLSAKTPSALESSTRALAQRLARVPLPLADVAYTLHVGRGRFRHRRALVCRDVAETAAALAAVDPSRIVSAAADTEEPAVVFMFPGQGAQFLAMGREVYRHEAVFREEVDRCADVLRGRVGFDLERVLFRDADGAAWLEETALVQPALFVTEYALARQLVEWGIRPRFMIGHSLGEYVAACLSGVLTLEDALELVTMRGRLMQALGEGAMLAVAAPPEALEPLPPGLSVAAINAPSRCVVSGPPDEVDEFEARVTAAGVAAQRLRTSRAFHSAMVDEALPALRHRVSEVRLEPPRIPYVSNVTGTWIRAEEATDPSYWAEHARRPVRFSDGASLLLAQPRTIFLEVGPGRTLGTQLAMHAAGERQPVIVPTLPGASADTDHAALLGAVARAWVTGVPVDWERFHAHERRGRVELPTYPFEGERFGTAVPKLVAVAPAAPATRAEIERAVAEAWQELLGVEEVGATDNYFELGGDSLLAIRLVARLRAVFRVDLAVASLMAAPTVAEQADVIIASGGGSVDEPPLSEEAAA